MRIILVVIAVLLTSYAHGYSVFVNIEEKALTWNDTLVQQGCIRWNISKNAPAICRESMLVATQAWTAASNGAIRFKLADHNGGAHNAANCDIWVDWDTGGALNPLFIACATFGAGSDGNILYGKIVINASSYIFDRNLLFDGCVKGNANLDSTLMHELGHILGLNHADQDKAHIIGSYGPDNYPTMWSVLWPGTSSLHEDDIAGIQYLYPTPMSDDSSVPMIYVSPLDQKLAFLKTNKPLKFELDTFAIIDWNFGDGTVVRSNGEGVVHRFKKKGKYTVTAEVFGLTITKQIEIHTRKPKKAAVKSKLKSVYQPGK
jgi:hypothetical protein